MLVWVASYQRSGNTLTMRTLAEVFGVARLGAIEQKGLFMDGWFPGDFTPPDDLVGLPQNQLLKVMRARPEPFFIKSHRIADAADPGPALYVVRDGRDVHVSRAHWYAAKEVGSHELPFEVRLMGLVIADRWSRHVLTWRTRSGPTAIVRFERLIEDPAGAVRKGCEEIGIELGEPVGELTPFERLHERNPVMHRRGETGAWKDEMPLEVERRFWRTHGREMKALGYTERPSRRARRARASA